MRRRQSHQATKPQWSNGKTINKVWWSIFKITKRNKKSILWNGVMKASNHKKTMCIKPTLQALQHLKSIKDSAWLFFCFQSDILQIPPHWRTKQSSECLCISVRKKAIGTEKEWSPDRKRIGRRKRKSDAIFLQTKEGWRPGFYGGMCGSVCASRLQLSAC